MTDKLLQEDSAKLSCGCIALDTANKNSLSPVGVEAGRPIRSFEDVYGYIIVLPPEDNGSFMSDTNASDFAIGGVISL